VSEETGVRTAAEARWPNVQVTIWPWHLEHRAGACLRCGSPRRRSSDEDRVERRIQQRRRVDALPLFGEQAARHRHEEAETGHSRPEEAGLRPQPARAHAVRTEGMASLDRRPRSATSRREGDAQRPSDAFTNKKRTDLMLGLVTLHP